MEILRPLDPRRADARVDMRLAQAEQAFRSANRSAAEQWWAAARVLDEARQSPEVFVDPLLPLSAEERVEFAVRAAVADIAVRLGISESTVRDQAHAAEVLQQRLPRVWDAFCDGEVPVPNARYAVDLLASLPDDVDTAARFDEALAGCATLAPARFRARARVLRERVHPVPLAERARAARETRAIWIENLPDGMAEILLRLPADTAHSAYARIDAAARALARVPDETRTLAQLRADVAGDVLLAGDGGPSARFAVAVTVPVLTLLGAEDDPGTLDGYGPIDAETARRIAAHAPSFMRLLTHPVTGGLLDIDRGTYRPPADLKRWMAVTDQYCTFTGCVRLARTCDLDHTVDYQHGGETRSGNLGHLCRHHHRVKHQTKWSVVQNPAGSASRSTWTSPTGFVSNSDPPPF
ncbi:MAG TPA: DUF222 domain-containing protein [Pseudolysinimonas sp.]|nr:DUF222 domain-containing protein [Pseudolysinimonas sp.]